VCGGVGEEVGAVVMFREALAIKLGMCIHVQNLLEPLLQNTCNFSVKMSVKKCNNDEPTNIKQ
jgi:hypothetical protein